VRLRYLSSNAIDGLIWVSTPFNSISIPFFECRHHEASSFALPFVVASIFARAVQRMRKYSAAEVGAEVHAAVSANGAEKTALQDSWIR